MKKIFCLLMIAGSPLHAWQSVRDEVGSCTTGAVSVSTTTPTAIPTSALSSRNQITLINTDPTYDLAIGTSSAITYASGFIVTNSTDHATARLQFRLPYDQAIYGLGQANAAAGTINVRYLECK